uniref:Uncharacterized protein n=1 Tax=Anguilla anguilla TaxID=7936 RepID=A0A0E9U7K1_ANGAN
MKQNRSNTKKGCILIINPKEINHKSSTQLREGDFNPG